MDEPEFLFNLIMMTMTKKGEREKSSTGGKAGNNEGEGRSDTSRQSRFNPHCHIHCTNYLMEEFHKVLPSKDNKKGWAKHEKKIQLCHKDDNH